MIAPITTMITRSWWGLLAETRQAAGDGQAERPRCGIEPDRHPPPVAERDFRDIGNAIAQAGADDLAGEIRPQTIIADLGDDIGEGCGEAQRLRHFLQDRFGHGLGRGLGDQIAQVADLEIDGPRHLFGHTLEMALNEDHRYEKLQRQDGQDQDKQGAPVKPARHVVFEPAEEHDREPIARSEPREAAMSAVEEMGNGIGRILAPNPSPMTFRGTNTYLIGRQEVAVVDPGPDDPAHLAAIMGAVAGRVTHILITHSHVDHSAAIPALKRATGAPVLAFGDSDAGMSEQMRRFRSKGWMEERFGVDEGFVPDWRLADGDVLETGEWRIRAHHTPGHMGNHLSFAKDGDLLTGDFVMGWSSSMISPPDGDLRDFLASCRRMAGLGFTRLLPGHGDPVTDPAARFAELIAHREMRTDQILAVLSAAPATVEDLMEEIYPDIPDHLIRAAGNTLFAHIFALLADGLLAAEGEDHDMRFSLRRGNR